MDGFVGRCDAPVGHIRDEAGAQPAEAEYGEGEEDVWRAESERERAKRLNSGRFASS